MKPVRQLFFSFSLFNDLIDLLFFKWIMQFYDFSRLFGGVRRSGGTYAEGSAYFALPGGRMAQVVIACRPERRPEEKYVMEIAELFRTSA